MPFSAHYRVEIALAVLAILGTRNLLSHIPVLIVTVVAIFLTIAYQQLAPSHLLAKLEDVVSRQRSTWIRVIEGDLLPKNDYLFAMLKRDIVRFHYEASKCRHMHEAGMQNFTVSMFVTHVFALRRRVRKCEQLAEDLEHRVKVAVEEEHQARCREQLARETVLAEFYGGGGCHNL